MKIYTVGHSTLSLTAFLHLLKSHGIGLIADIRRFPQSRRHPHFSGEVLRESLNSHGIGYRHYEPLGGRRSKMSDHSRNSAWSVSSFQYYADYMETAPFRKAAARLLKEAESRTTAVMCAEAVYFKCHRRLVADYLTVLGHEVIHIETTARTRPHTLPEFAVVKDGDLSYPPASRSVLPYETRRLIVSL